MLYLKQKIKRCNWWYLILWFLVIVFLLPQFALAQQEKVTIEFWKHTHLPADKYAKELIKEFTEIYPNVRIEMLNLGWSQHLQKLVVSLGGGIGPTLFDAIDPFVPLYISKGFVAPIDYEAFGFDSQSELEESWIPGSLSPAKQNGVVYGVPFEINSWSLYINMNHFREAGLDPDKDYPHTWKEVGEIGGKLAKYDASGRMIRAGFQWPLKLPGGWYLLTWCPILYQLGGSVLNEDKTECVVNSPAGVKALQIWYDMIYKYKTATVDFGTMNSKEPQVDFARGDLSMWLTGAWARPTLESYPEVYNNYKVVPTPHVKGRPRVAGVNAIYWLVNKAAPGVEKKWAWHFVEFCSRHQEGWLKKAGYIIPRKGWFKSPVAREFPYLDVFLDDISHGKPRPRSAHYSEIADALVRAIQRTMFNRVPPQQSLDQCKEEIDSALK